MFSPKPFVPMHRISNFIVEIKKQVAILYLSYFTVKDYSLLRKNSLIKYLLYFSFHRDIFVNNASILLNYFFLTSYNY